MQKPSNRDAAWEIAVPNGVHHVNVTCGDLANVDSRYRIAAEGVPLPWTGSPLKTASSSRTPRAST